MAARSQLRRVVEALRSLGINAILELERRDPQYRAVCSVVGKHGESIGARLAMLNAVISYRLTGRGEEHWEFFGKFFTQLEIRDVCRDFLRYLDASPYLRIGLDGRRKRVLKICNYAPNLEDLGATLRQVSSLLGARSEQKTIVFAVKILNYVYMCSRGVDRILPFDIPIPVDYRVAHLTWCAGLIDLPPREAMRRYEVVQRIWDEVAREAGIPPLHIDTLLWLAGRAVLYGENIHGVSEGVIALFQRRRDCKPLLK